MKIIIVDNLGGRNRLFAANRLFFGLLLAGLIGVPATTGYFAYKAGLEEATVTSHVIGHWQELLGQQQETLENLRQESEHNLGATTLRLAQLQARIVRLDALGERLIKVGNLDAGEFDFSLPPAMGGPENLVDVSADTPPAFIDLLDQLTRDIEDREQQLAVLDSLLITRKTQRDSFLAGRPVQKGWMSSGYGYRNDPITGQRAWHSGVDFAGKAGANVTAVAAGVVLAAGAKGGYGRMVEINHGAGYSTRYGHQKLLKVQAGDVVQKGEVIGLMGSSGRATGPHVHFEVFKNGRVVDPSTYIHRTNR